MTIIPKKAGARRKRVAAESGATVALRNVGLRLTDPRRVVLDVVRGTEAHPTAEAIHRLVRRRLPRVSLGTVYRNLRVLVAEGLVKEMPGRHARFDGNASDHHHFTCLACGRIADVEESLTAPHSRALVQRVVTARGFNVTHHRFEFYGRCPSCRSKSSRPPSRRPPQ